MIDQLFIDCVPGGVTKQSAEMFTSRFVELKLTQPAVKVKAARNRHESFMFCKTVSRTFLENDKSDESDCRHPTSATNSVNACFIICFVSI